MMTLNTRFIKWFTLNALFGIVVFYALSGKVSGAYNVLVFVTWVLFLLSLTMLSDAVTNELVKKNHKFAVPGYVDVTYDLGITMIMVWFGSWFLRALYLLHMFFTMVGRIRFEEALKRKGTSNE